ncbi:hypothetical protein FJZ27_00915 [Candidatus Peribacteria bacterium]|nr:hypothetical protein [Candidatus Peribacteria bacterium]
MQKSCTNCGRNFEIRDDDLAFYEKVSPVFTGKKYSIPVPELCPECRQQRRLAFRNERKFYHRKCDLTGKQIISMYSPDKPLTVYQSDEWWSDKWDPMTYGRDVDFSRPFFEQFKELRDAVPRAALFGKNNENSDYTNHTENSKNCYICADTVAQDTYYSKWMINCRDCCDCYQLEKTERCYESQYTVTLQNAIYAFLCDQSSNVYFCYDCIDCQDCLLCSHLRHKRFCIFNEQLTEEDYRKRLSELNLGSYRMFQEVLRQYKNMLRQTFHRSEVILFSENCFGDFIYHCKNVHDSFGVIESQDAAYCYDTGHQKDSQDVYESAFDGELQFQSHACNRGKRLIGCSVCYDVHSCIYCDTCHNSSDLFGCVGLRRKKYCILNKEYSKEEYEKFATRIIEHMQKTGEWGQYYPPALTPFAYNESLAQEYFPFEKEAAERGGWMWYEEKAEDSYLGPETEIPDDIRNVSDDICQKILRCAVTRKPYKIIPQELKFYREMSVPIPRLSPEERHKQRMAFTNPRRLWERTCSNCAKTIRTTYAPDRPEIVYCESCYLKEVY